MQKRVEPFSRAARRTFHDLRSLHQLLPLDRGLVAGRLRAVGAILGTATGLDAQQGAELDLVLGPVFLVNRPGLFQEVEEWLVIDAFEFVEVHENRSLRIT